MITNEGETHAKTISTVHNSYVIVNFAYKTSLKWLTWYFYWVLGKSPYKLFYHRHEGLHEDPTKIVLIKMKNIYVIL